jgi:Reverse transcriptase (RNA-dependent DNA polymerase)
MGISLKRWQLSITTMIEKIPGTRINKLRVIHQYKADYKLLLKVICTRRLVWNAHDRGKINDGQAGSRPGRNAIDVVIQKEMKHLYCRETRTGMATMDNAAKSCYNRIICNLAMINSQYYRLSTTTTNIQAKTLLKMRHRLRTALGDLKNYEHTENTPIHGMGQGSRASPSIWLLISSILMDCLSELGGGMVLNDVTPETIQQWIDGFVDDTSLFVNLLDQECDPNDIKLLHERLQHDMILWKELLESSSGKLELQKCFYYVMPCKFQLDRKPVPITISEQCEVCKQITILDNQTNCDIAIAVKETNEIHQTQGCIKTIEGIEVGQARKSKKQSDIMGNKIKNARFNRKQARKAYNAIYFASRKYGLPATSFSCKTIESIHRYVVGKFLLAMVYDRSTHRALIFGPQKYRGFGVRYTPKCKE